MGINTDFFTQRKAVMWGDVEACTVRGITPNDIAKVMAENASEVESIMESVQKEKVLSSLDPSQVHDIDLNAESEKIFKHIITMVPNLAAKIIAIAADDADNWEVVRDKFVLPLQFEALTVIAQLTFIDGNGFKKFLGNVLALAGSVNGQRQIGQPASVTRTGTNG